MVEEFEFYDTEQRALIDWLSSRSPDVWHVVAEYLNPDYAEGVIEWILNQPQCDRATAAFFFWRFEPARNILSRSPDQEEDEYNFYFRLVGKANEGFYSNSNILYRGNDLPTGEVCEWTLKEAQSFRELASQGSETKLAWTLPEAFVPVFGKRAPAIAENDDPAKSQELRALLEDLGVIFPSPQPAKPPQGGMVLSLGWLKNLGKKKR
ncbi:MULTISPECIES: DUF4274 domain-containing protein [unclassified Rhizobium]|uniref:DUF4274 domain-containing protein n=1 Tax=unclassified Rhizobium TaxID=2613769 RepID=UPI00288A62BF|nr:MULTISPECIES: DUF4274 domain-containing protein [unclassified Rhizobium]